MKFFQICMITTLLLVLSSCLGRRLTRREMWANAYLPEFAKGIKLALVSNMDIKPCIPWKWKHPETTKVKLVLNFATSAGHFKNLEKKIESKVYRACRYKKQIIKFLQNKIGGSKGGKKFLEHVSKKNKINWGFLKKQKGKKKKFDPKVLSNIVGSLKGIKHAMDSIIKNEVFKEIQEFIRCVSMEFKNFDYLNKNVKYFQPAMKKVFSEGWGGAIEVLMNGICDWYSFQPAITYLIIANKEKNLNKKLKLIGQFFGNFVTAVGASKRPKPVASPMFFS